MKIKTMDPINNKPESRKTDWFDLKTTSAASDPFAREGHSASEIQEREKDESEKHPDIPPAIPGNLPPERTIHPLPERPEQPRPEIPAEPGRSAPEIIKLPGTDKPEWQAPANPELPPERNVQQKPSVFKKERIIFPSIRLPE